MVVASIHVETDSYIYLMFSWAWDFVLLLVLIDLL